MPVVPLLVLEGNSGQKTLALIGTGSTFFSAARLTSNPATPTPIPNTGALTLVSFATGTLDYQVPATTEEPEVVAEIGNNGVRLLRDGVYLAIAFLQTTPDGAATEMRGRIVRIIGGVPTPIDPFAQFDGVAESEGWCGNLFSAVANDLVGVGLAQTGGAAAGDVDVCSLMVIGPLALS